MTDGASGAERTSSVVDGDVATSSPDPDAWTGTRRRVDSVPQSLAQLPQSSAHAIITTPDVTAPSYPDDETATVGTALSHDEWASSCLQILRPGGHLIAIAGPQTFYRMWAGIEDAGFTLRDTLTVLHRSGSHDDTKTPRVESETGISLVALAQRPFSTSVAENLLEYGTGALDIDALRVPVNGSDEKGSIGSKHTSAPVTNEAYGDGFTHPPTDHDSGRYPPTLFLDHATADTLDDDNAVRTSTGGRSYHNKNDMYSGEWGIEEGTKQDPGFGDEGGPSRYFHQLPTRTSDSDIENGRYYSLHFLAHHLVRLFTREGNLIIEPFAEPFSDELSDEEQQSVGTVQHICDRLDRRYIGLTAAENSTSSESDRTNVR